MIYILAVSESHRSSISTLEWIVSIVLTLLIIGFHFLAATSSAALWRDEANTIAVANLPTVRDLLESLFQRDSFPILWFAIVRGFSSVFGAMNDAAFRTLGFSIGLGVLGALWLNARAFRHTFPFFSLTLFALSPSVIVWGDSMRAYGFGLLLILIACAQLWRFVESPTWPRFFLAAAAAIASAHTLLYNPILILAFCTGAMAVSLRQGERKKAVKVLMIGILSAVSLLPYTSAIKASGRWSALVKIDAYTFSWFTEKMIATLTPAGFFTPVLWMGLLIIALAAAAFSQRDPVRSAHQRDAILFSLVALLVGVPAHYAFLKIMSYHTQAWYYLAMLALMAVMIDIIFGALLVTPRARLARLGFVIAVVSLSLPHVHASVQKRMTNVDIIANWLETQATREDFIVVNPWYVGITFNRYYDGRAEWMTIPEMSFHDFHRYDLLKESMMAADQEEPVRRVMERIAATLKSGHRVFFVGDLTVPPPGQSSKTLPPAPLSKWGWQDGAYATQWEQIVGLFVSTHASQITAIPVMTDQEINRFENMTLGVIEGWTGD